MGYIGKYKIIRELGAGGFGAVYLAEDPKLGELVAIKVFQINDDNLARLATSATSDASDVLNQRFLNEARTLRQLGKNPHIVNVFEFDELDDGRPYYVMPYLPKSLKDELGSDATDISVISELPADEKPKRLPINQSLIYLTQLLKALSDVHKAGLVHRDIKPVNVLLNEDDEVQLCDFGIAKLPDVQHSQSGIGMGSRNYMAPEQRQSAKHVDSRSDIYSVGVLAYRMITGTLPEGRFGEPNTFQPTISDTLNDLILKSLEQQKENRFQDAAAMLKALKQAVQSQPNSDNEETSTWVGGNAEQIGLGIKAELKPLEKKIIELLQNQGEVRENDKIYLQALADIADVDEDGLKQLIIQVTEQQQNSSAEQKALIQWASGINKRLNTNQGQLDDTYMGSAISAGTATTGKSETQLQQLLSEKITTEKAKSEKNKSEKTSTVPVPETDLSITAPVSVSPVDQSRQRTNTFIIILLLFVSAGGYAGFNYYQAEQLKAQQLAIAEKNEQSAWTQAQQLNTIAGYQLYLQSWPEGQNSAQAKTKQTQLTEQARLAQLSVAEKRSEHIKQAQQLLIELNYQISKTGKLDTRTKKAIEQFEQSQKLITTGEVDEVLLTNLTKAEQALSKAKVQEQLEQEKAKIAANNAADDLAWKKAMKTNTQKSYRFYAKTWANGRYIKNINNAIANIAKVNAARYKESLISMRKKLFSLEIPSVGSQAGVGAYIKIAISQAKANDIVGSRKSFKMAESKAKTFARNYIDIAVAYASVGNVADSKRWFKEALALIDSGKTSRKDSTLSDLALAQARIGDFSSAFATVKKSSNISIYQASALKQITEIQAKSGDFTSALSTARMIETHYDYEFDAYMAIAENQFQAGDVSSSKRAYAMASMPRENNNNLVRAKCRAAKLQADYGNMQAARSLLSSATHIVIRLRNKARKNEGYHDIAKSLAEIGFLSEALSLANKIDDSANGGCCYKNNAMSFIERGQADSYINLKNNFNQAKIEVKKIDSKDYRNKAFRNIAVSQANKGDFSAAFATLKLIEGSETVDSYIDVVKIQHQAGEMDSAKKVLEQLVSALSKSESSESKWSYYNNIANAQILFGDLKSAVNTIKLGTKDTTNLKGGDRDFISFEDGKSVESTAIDMEEMVTARMTLADTLTSIIDAIESPQRAVSW